MNKRTGFVSVFLSRLIIIGFIAQIVMGIIWGAKNIGYLQLFGESADLVAVSGTMRCNVYTGVIYPAVLLMVRAVCMAFGLPWYTLMYLLQLALALTSGCVFLRAYGKNRYGRAKYFFGSLVLTTFPFMLQIHLAILTESLALSFFILEMAYVRKAWGSTTLADARGFSLALGRICLFWFLTALTQWDFIIIGAVPVIILFIRALVVLSRTDRKGIGFPLLILACFLVFIIGTYTFIENPYAPSTPTKSLEVSLFDRTAWDAAAGNGNVRYEIWNIVGDELTEEYTAHRGTMKTLVEPRIEASLGKKGARDFFLRMAKEVWSTRKSTVIHDAAIDLAGYIIPPVVTRSLFEKRAFLSYTGRNYDVMKRVSPQFTKVYMDYSLFWFEAALMIAGVLYMLWIFKGIREKKKPGPGVYIIAVTILTGILIAVRNTFLGYGMYDYKIAGFSTALWITLILFSTDGAEAK